MKIKVLCLGRSAKEVDIDESSTVEAAIKAAGFPTESNYTRHLNGAPVMDSDLVTAGSVLTLVPQVKGGLF